MRVCCSGLTRTMRPSERRCVLGYSSWGSVASGQTCHDSPGPGESWQVWPEATEPQDEYPKTHLLSDGRIVRVSPEQQTRILDPVTHAWTHGPLATYGYRQDASSVLLP